MRAIEGGNCNILAKLLSCYRLGCICELISPDLGRLLVESDLLCQVADERLLGDELPGFGVVDRVLTARCVKQVLPFNRERFIDISSCVLDVCFDISQLVYVESLGITRGMEGWRDTAESG